MDQHYVLTGKTGSGKSFYGSWLLHRYYMANWHIVYIDIEAKVETFAKPGEVGILRKPHLYKEQIRRSSRVTYYVPSLPGWSDAKLEQIYEQALQQPYTIIYHDEIIGIATESQFPNGLVRLYSQGRKKHVLGIICTQRSVCIPKICLSQAGIVAAFYMSDEDDKKKIAKRIGLYETELQWEDQYGYYFYNEQTMDKAEYRPPLTLSRKDIKHGERRLARRTR